jgi:Cdc6-like AAA superfamily ATPase
MRALLQRGLHIGMYGERGVGKTSMAKVLPDLIRDLNLANVYATRVDCSTLETFASIWRIVFRDLGIDSPEVDRHDFGPQDVRFRLERDKRKLLIVIDELDRMEGDGSGADDSDVARTLLADTLKTLSNSTADATIMLVGVADTFNLLLGDHLSIVRSIVQVHMPRMSDEEASQIIDTGYARTDLQIEPGAKNRVLELAEGLPHFVHLIALHAGELTVQNDDHVVTKDFVNRSLLIALEKHDLVSEYDSATKSPQKANLYEKVLLACAYASRDPLGYFRPNDVVAPLSIILGRPVEHATFQQHLHELSGKRAQTLKRDGSARKYRFRFQNPLLQAFTKIRAISTGLIDQEQRVRLEALSPRRSGLGPLFEPRGQE